MEVKNLTLMNDIKNLVGNENFFLSDELGFDSLFIESAAFGFISIRTLKKITFSFPRNNRLQKKNVCGEIFNLRLIVYEVSLNFFNYFNFIIIKK